MHYQHHPVLEELIVMSPMVHEDQRGCFFESYQQQECRNNNIVADFVQDNHSVSHYGVLRGLHYQLPPFAQAKLIRCIVGEILDVVLDMRISSVTFGRYASFSLSAINRSMLWIPVGFAHGFIALADNTEIVYKTTAVYSAMHESGVNCYDPQLAINWQLPMQTHIISEKDQLLPMLSQATSFA